MISKVNILLVDDNSANLLALAALLEDLEENIVQAQSGAEALQALSEQDYAVILLDVQMPGMDGFETAHLIMQREASRDIPIIFLTAFDMDPAAALRGYATGAVDYLIKPIVPEVLKAKVRTFVDLCKKSLRMKEQLEVIWELKHQTNEQKRLVEAQQAFLEREQAAFSQAELAQKRQTFLAEASNLLASSLDYAATLQGLARLCVPVLADWCSVHVVEENGQLRTADIVAQRTETVDTLMELRQRYPFDPNADSGIAYVLRTGETLFNPTLDPAAIANYARDAEHFALIQRLGATSAILTPIQAHGKTLGVISLNRVGANQHYTPEDLALAKDLAHRAALALDNAKLYSEAQEAIRDRDEFLSIAAHELKTPVTSLRGFAQTILRQLDKETPVDPLQIQRALQVIDRQSHKLTFLITRLLDISRIQSGHLDLMLEETDLGQLAEEVVGRMRLQTSAHSLLLSVPAPVQVHVDPLRLEQVLTNLLDNAIKYSPQGGTIETEVLVKDQAIVLSVRDHGLGLPPETQAQLFNRFYRAHADQYISGLGLGLFISQQIIQLHAGQLSVESPSDGGTRFIVTLPKHG